MKSSGKHGKQARKKRKFPQASPLEASPKTVPREKVPFFTPYGGFDPVLVGLADALSVEAFSAENLAKYHKD